MIAVFAVTLWACNPPPEKEPAPKPEPVRTPEVEKPKPPEPARPDVTAIAKAGWTSFKDPTFAGSLNPLACQSCHPYGGRDHSVNPKAKGTLMGVAKTFPKVVTMVSPDPITLEDMINFCITKPMEATALGMGDPLMQGMSVFIRALESKGFEKDALPVIMAKCTGCHTGNAPTSPAKLDDMATAVSKAGKIRELVDTAAMPKTGTLTDMEYLTLIIWATTETDKT